MSNLGVLLGYFIYLWTKCLLLKLRVPRIKRSQYVDLVIGTNPSRLMSDIRSDRVTNKNILGPQCLLKLYKFTNTPVRPPSLFL